MKIFAALSLTFLGQSPNLKLEKRVILMILLNIILLSSVMYGIIYQSIITAFMMEPPADHQLKSIQDLKESSYKIHASRVFQVFLNESHEYPEIRKKIAYNISYDEAVKQRLVLIFFCENSEFKYHREIFGEIFDKEIVNSYYMLPEMFLSYFRFHDAGIINPHLDRLQYYMDWSFAAGLTDHWEMLHSLKASTRHKIEERSSEEDAVMLTMNDLHQNFIILYIGFSLSFLAFLCEYFYYKCRTKLRAFLGINIGNVMPFMRPERLQNRNSQVRLVYLP